MIIDESFINNSLDLTTKKSVITQFTKNCPKCNDILYYKTIDILRISKKENRLCRNCIKNVKREKIFKRICPKCKKEVYHTTERSARVNKDVPCKDCSHIGLTYKVNKRVYTKEELSRNCPRCNREIIYKRIESKKRADKQNRVCQHCVGDYAITFRKPFSEETIDKFRLNFKNRADDHFNRTGKTLIRPFYNPTACEYFNELNKQNGWNLRHALNGGEIWLDNGYFPDAYDKERNIIVEYDEPYHDNPKQKKEDLIRMRNIINYLHCKFYRYNEKRNVLIDCTDINYE